jgi:hypothetical protein
MVISICRPQMAGPPFLNGARSVQGRDDLRRRFPRACIAGPQGYGVGRRAALPECRCRTDHSAVRYRRVIGRTRRLPNKEERRTKATPEPPPRGHDVAHGRRSLPGARRLCCHRVSRAREPELAVFRETAGRSRVIQFFMRRVAAATCSTPSMIVGYSPASAYHSDQLTPRDVSADRGNPACPSQPRGCRPGALGGVSQRRRRPRRRGNASRRPKWRSALCTSLS